MTAAGLSRASSEAAANVRAARIFSLLPLAWVSDATCGIGADTLALSRAGSMVLASDLDPHLVACTSANLVAYGHAARAVVADCLRPPAHCDALILDSDSRSDTYPYIEIDEDDVVIEHEASVSKIAEEQLFYLMSRGMTEVEASSMIVTGFIEPLVKELPMEYAVEMNRLIELQMEGSVG